MPKKTYRELPTDYRVCLHTNCPMAATCLHQIAYSQLLKKETILRLINPEMCSKDKECTFYRDSKPVTYAFGFTNFQKKMFPAQYETFMYTLIGKFGRNAYFERRRGESPLSPKEQEIILEALGKAGVTEKMPFDKYEEIINWYD
ncbi:MAG: hypothetical protein IKO73_05195 [Bacteroidaceae bacterium]|nr:hypothetical protein [Bacteroidaceae bacterium]